MYYLIQDVYHFPHMLFTLYQIDNPDFHAVGQFCQEMEQGAVTISYNILTYEAVNTLKSYGLAVFVHTLNWWDEVKYANRFAIDGIYSDTLSPAQLEAEGLFLPWEERQQVTPEPEPEPLPDQENLDEENLEGENLDQENLDQENLDQENLDQENLDQENLGEENLEGENLEGENLEGENLEEENSAEEA